eukprot:601500-Prorocentrum_minimum.AAC.1
MNPSTQRCVYCRRSSENTQRASTPTTDGESRCTVHKGGTWFAECSPVSNNSDDQDSQKLGSVCFKQGLIPRTNNPYWAGLLHRCTARPMTGQQGGIARG